MWNTSEEEIEEIATVVLFINQEEFTEHMYPGYGDLARKLAYMNSTIIGLIMEKSEIFYLEKSSENPEGIVTAIGKIFGEFDESVFQAVPKLLEQYGKECTEDLRQLLDWRNFLSKHLGKETQPVDV